MIYCTSIFVIISENLAGKKLPSTVLVPLRIKRKNKNSKNVQQCKKPKSK